MAFATRTAALESRDFWHWEHAPVFALLAAAIAAALTPYLIATWPAPLEAFWGWLNQGHGADGVTNGASLRNVGLLALASFGLPLLVWRSVAAHRQAAHHIQQVEAGRQINRNGRFQRAAETLGADSPEERMAGLVTLDELRHEDPHAYHVPVMRLLTFCLSNMRAEDSAGVGSGAATGWESRYSDDELRMIFLMLGARDELMKRAERSLDYRPKLIDGRVPAPLVCSDRDYRGFRFERMDLSEIRFERCDFSEAGFDRCQLRECEFVRGKMAGVTMTSNAIDGAVFDRVRRLGPEFLNSNVYAKASGSATFTDASTGEKRHIEVDPAGTRTDEPDATQPD